ncbi:MAG TPA: hypothetical protein VHK01_12085 [Lacipirellulaceae bacterium]|jgi:hypothetical protein|nr:hypothetical protein [Lacipirellulaceae bacterium]
MQLGKSLVGAIIGGLVGIALCIAITKLSGGWDTMWLAIPVALVTGLGVRWMATTKGHPSYARGALTAIIAIAAFLASFPIAAQITTQGAAARPINAQASAEPANDAADDAADAPANDAQPAAPAREPGSDLAGPGPMRQRPPDRSPWEYVALGIAALVAYELGRGSGVARPGVVEDTAVREEPAPAPRPGQFPPSD